MNHGGPDVRFSTRNTNLAACIGALMVPVKPVNPITVTRDYENGNQIVLYWFENAGIAEFCGQKHRPLEIESHWNDREVLERDHKAHPLIPMRKALEKRDWLTGAWHGRVGIATSLDKPGFKTEDIHLAATIMALGFPILQLDKPNYIFRKIPKWIVEDFNNYLTPGCMERPAALMRRALEARAEWVAAAKDRLREAQLKFTDGPTDEHSGRMAFISEKAHEREIERTLDILHRP